MLYILIAILMFGILIALHEFGHFAAAKLCGVKVNEFAIGMGPKLFHRKGEETEYTIRALHNDILMLYIDAGFWGFLAWMLCYFPLRTWCVIKWQGLRGGILCLCLEAYILATAATDNTIYYLYVTGALAICLMCPQLEDSGYA